MLSLALPYRPTSFRGAKSLSDETHSESAEEAFCPHV